MGRNSKLFTRQGLKKEISSFEKGAIVKRKKGLIRFALVYPNSYQAGMSSLGFQSLYSLINEFDNVACERVFLPDKGETQNSITSCETGLALSLFDIIAFSVSFENDYLNIVSILRNSGIPLQSSKRSNDHPLVIAGGVACFLNPEPIALFIDCFLLGEAESLIKEFFDIYNRHGRSMVNASAVTKNESHLIPDSWKDLDTLCSTSGINIKPRSKIHKPVSREELKKRFARELKGAYVPSLYRPIYSKNGKYSGLVPEYDDIPEKIKVRRVKDLAGIQTTTTIITSKTAFKNIFLIETGRGCPHGCRFCSAGFIYRPPRFYPADVIIDAMDQAKKVTDRVGLVSAAVSDHPEINQICLSGMKKNLKISFSSLRVDALTDDLIKNLVNSGAKTATIAPEAGSERMRCIINKKITEDEILSAAGRLIEAGIINLKLYFMIGLPFEEDDDVEEIVVLTEKIRNRFLAASRKQKKIGTITLSVNPFVPKPGTPFQWSAMLPLSGLKKRLKIIKSGLKKSPNIRINAESHRMSKIHALLSRGDRRMAEFLENAADSGWSTALKLKQHKEYYEDQLYAQRLKEDPLPWDFIDTGVNKSFLLKESLRAEAAC